MTTLQPIQQLDLQTRAIRAALSGLALHSRRIYQSRIQRYIDWSNGGTKWGVILDRESVKAWMRAQELSGASAQVRNQSLAALKRLAAEAAELGWIDPNQAAQIARIKAKRITGIRTGRWLSTAQSRELIEECDRTTPTGRRDAAVLALLLGCGLRRAEVCSLTLDHLRWHNDKLILTNLIGKGGRVRSVAVPVWAAQLIQEWIEDLAQ